MHLLLLAADLALTRSWFLLPLVVIISLVYSASRYESPERIVRRAAKVAVQILGFMAVVLVVLVVLSWNL
jgi:uncharacterized membrane protein YidH (DUF202 family)